VRVIALVAAVLVSAPAQAADIYETLQTPPKATWQAANTDNLEYCVVLALANRTRQAPTVAKRPGETVIVVHDWDSPVPGSKVQGLVTIKSGGLMEFRGAKDWLADLVAPCTR
jgi:hypothetical protein